MKINFIESDKETEITLKGRLSNPEVAQLLYYLEQLNSPDKLLLYRDECVHPIALKDILYFEVEDRKCYAFTKSESYLTKLKLYELAELKSFAQIGKSTIVNLDYIDYFAPEFSGNFILYLKSSDKTLILSRKYAKSFINILKGGVSC